jgi:DNA-binding protein Fis
MAELEKQHLLTAMRLCDGNRTHAAKMLNISVRTLRYKLLEYDGTAADDKAESEELTEV